MQRFALVRERQANPFGASHTSTRNLNFLEPCFVPAFSKDGRAELNGGFRWYSLFSEHIGLNAEVIFIQ